jgi:hypothetical protein
VFIRSDDAIGGESNDWQSLIGMGFGIDLDYFAVNSFVKLDYKTG